MRSRRRTAPRSARSTAMRLRGDLVPFAAGGGVCQRRHPPADLLERGRDRGQLGQSEGSGRCGGIPPSSPIRPRPGNQPRADRYAAPMLRRLDLRGHGPDFRGGLPRPNLVDEGPVAEVRAIVDDVRMRGDAALREYTARFDRVDLDEIRVPASEIGSARGRLDPALLAALTEAAQAIESFHRHRPVNPGTLRTQRDLGRPPRAAGRPRRGLCPRWAGELPLERSHDRHPGSCRRRRGRRRLRASCAGRRHPGRGARGSKPGRGGRALPCRRATGDRRHGLWHRDHCAASMSSSVRGAGGFRSPSSKSAARSACRLRSPGLPKSSSSRTSRYRSTTSRSTSSSRPSTDPTGSPGSSPGRAGAERGDSCRRLPRRESPRRAEIEATLADGGYAVLVDGPEAAMAVSNEIAPEHLELCCDNPQAMIPLVRNAGAVFLGPYTPASLGDYIAGPSHTLPTFGSARYASVLGVEDFLRRVHVISADAQALRRRRPPRCRDSHAPRVFPPTPAR